MIVCAGEQWWLVSAGHRANNIGQREMQREILERRGVGMLMLPHSARLLEAGRDRYRYMPTGICLKETKKRISLTVQKAILPKGNIPGAFGDPGPGHRPAQPHSKGLHDNGGDLATMLRTQQWEVSVLPPWCAAQEAALKMG